MTPENLQPVLARLTMAPKMTDRCGGQRIPVSKSHNPRDAVENQKVANRAKWSH